MTRVAFNRVRRGAYFDSVALMRAAARIEGFPGIAAASLMMGAEANKAMLRDAGLLDHEGEAAGPNDLIVAVTADTARHAEAACDAGEAELAGLRASSRSRARSLAGAVEDLPGANLALISVPGAHAAAQARAALARGLHVMVFSDNVSFADERALKELARRSGLLLMGPDCGTALIAGVALGFANDVRRGDIGIVAASGTGLQEVACLIDRMGRGISHAIGVGGRDLSAEIGGLATFGALDALEGDAATRHIVIVSKPPAPEVARALFARLASCAKTVTVCVLGASFLDMPANVRLARTLEDAAAMACAIAVKREVTSGSAGPARQSGRRFVRGLFAGGTLAAEAQIVLLEAGLAVASNVPAPGAVRGSPGTVGHLVLDLGADEFTIGRPHPMIAPAARNALVSAALADPAVAVVLIDLVIGHGAHDDPAGIVAGLGPFPEDGPAVIASVTGTDRDPQNRARQVAILRAANVTVADSNSAACALAAARIVAAR